MIIGAQKCGTSTLHDWLDQHPLLAGSTPKEIHHFDRPRGDLARYEAHFKGWRKRVRFESTPSYLYRSGTAQRIHDAYPDIRLVVMLREPGARAYSAWNHYRDHFERGRAERRLATDGPLYKALFKDRKAFPSFRECLEIELGAETEEPALLRRGRYAEQIATYQRTFGAQSMMVIGFRDFIDEPVRELNRVLGFLGLPASDWSFLRRRVVNARGYGEPMAAGDRAFLDDYFAAPNAALHELIGPVNW